LIALALFVFVGLCVVVGAILTTRNAEYRAARHEYAAVQSTYGAEPAAASSPSQGTALLTDATTAAARATTVPTTPPIIEPTKAPFYSSQVAALRKDNRDTVGWLDILGTDIQYPLVHGSDNEYYMIHTFKKKRNASGAIFLDCWNLPDFTDFNTVIYGHNMNDGSMFAGLREYRRQRFFDDHPTVEITLLDMKLTYRVFAAYTSKGESSADFRGQDCTTAEQRSTFIKAARKRSTGIASNRTVSRNDRLLTLVTCSGGTQPWFWVVHAVLVEVEH